MRGVLTALLASLALTACDGGGDPVEQALRETAAANQSATVRETATVVDAASTDQVWIDRAIAHNRETIALSEIALAQSRDPEIRRMAQAVKDARTREIGQMQSWKPATASGQ